jgi:hypothetical protein
MNTGYTEDPFAGQPQRMRRPRVGKDVPGSRRPHRNSYYSDDQMSPPRRPRRPTRAMAYDDYEGDNYYDGRDDHYERSYDYPPPPPRSRRPRPRPRPAPAQYYSDDDYYDRPPPRERSRSPPRKTEPRSSGGGSGAAVAIVVIILIVLLLYMFRGPILDFIENPPPLKYQEFPEGLNFDVRKEMTIIVEGTRQPDSISYILKSANPQDNKLGDFYLQDVKSVNPDPVPTMVYKDNSGFNQEILLWTDDNFANEDRDFKITYSITTRFYEWELEEEDSGVIADIPAGLKARYNHNEWMIDDDHDGVPDRATEDIDGDGKWDYRIEIDNPDIQRKARDLANGKTNVYRVVKNIYDYLTRDDILHYVPSSEGLPKDCTTTLSTRQGDCDDYSILFISLCRALDIPAWLELGVLYDRQQKRWGGHGWAKVAIPFEGGYTAATVDIVNKQFLFHDPYRFIEWVDTGTNITVTEYGELKDVSNLDYYYHSFSFRTYGSPRITSPDTNYFVTINMQEFGDKIKVPVFPVLRHGLAFLP